jgi:outer membrane protein OmpA-like peptidoglycan-associated protein
MTWHAATETCGGQDTDEISLVLLPPPSVEIWTLEDVFFEYDWYRLTDEAIAILDENIRKLREHPEARVALEATCDERGARVYNEFLAVARAQSVYDYMLRGGIDASRMEIRTLGETTRYDPRITDPGWALNRRVHFVILPE